MSATNLLIPNNTSGEAVASRVPVQVLSDSGAITIASGIVQLTKAGVSAITLAAPVADGLVLSVASTTAQAHTLTVAGGLAGAGAGADVGTFGGAILDGVTLYSYNDYWWQLPGSNVNVTFA